MVLWVGIIHYFTGPSFDTIQDSLQDMGKRFDEFDFIWVLLTIGTLYLIVFIVQKTSAKDAMKVTLWDNLEKIFYINAFIGIAAIVYSFLPHNSVIGLFLFILAKILVDFLLEKSRNTEKKENLPKN